VTEAADALEAMSRTLARDGLPDRGEPLDHMGSALLLALDEATKSAGYGASGRPAGSEPARIAGPPLARAVGSGARAPPGYLPFVVRFRRLGAWLRAEPARVLVVADLLLERRALAAFLATGRDVRPLRGIAGTSAGTSVPGGAGSGGRKRDLRPRRCPLFP
jgi:hypothetical protein